MSVAYTLLAAAPAGRGQRRGTKSLFKFRDLRTLKLPMLLGAHLIFSAYGFWLPNDPRGSWSDFASWELLRFGKATKVSTTRSVAHVSHDIALRKAAKRSLNHSEIRFNGAQALAIAKGFARAAREIDLRISCALGRRRESNTLSVRRRTTEVVRDAIIAGRGH